MKDFTDVVTVFLISAGDNPNRQLALAALKRQTSRFAFDVIRDFRPMSAAFQQMLLRCRTPYYIQVDEDMVLEPEAVETMVASMAERNPRSCMKCFKLRDVHLTMDIYGVKIYSHEILRHYPYDLAHPSCEVEQLERMRNDGYQHELSTQVVGLHSPKWTNELIFERYLNLMEKGRAYNYSWIEQLPATLWQILKQQATEQNLYAFLGACASILSKQQLLKGEKDYCSKWEQFGVLRSYLQWPRSATLYMTSRCSFRCRHCYRQYHAIEAAPDINMDLVDLLLSRFPDLQSFCLCGLGEPLENVHFLQVLRGLKQKRMVVGLVTNGSLLRRHILAIAETPPDYISVSLNAATADEHRQITGTDTFDTVVAGIRSSVEAGIPTYVSHICTKRNWDRVPEVLQLASSLGVREVHLHNLLPHFESDGDNESFRDLVLTDGDHDLVDALRERPESRIVTRFPVLIRVDEPPRVCAAPWTMIAVDGNGSISICNSVYPPRRENGSIRDGVVWHNPYCREFRCSLAGKLKPACQRCFRNWKWG